MKFNIIIGITCIAIGLFAGAAVRSTAPAAPPEPPHVTPIIPPPAPSPHVPVRLCPVTDGPCLCGCASGAECVCFPSWAKCGPECWAAKRNCVVFVGVKPRKLDGFVCMSDASFCDGSTCIASGIIVGVWRSGTFQRHDLPATATDADIRAKLIPAPAGSSRPVGSVQVPTEFYQSSAGCATCVRGR